MNDVAFGVTQALDDHRNGDKMDQEKSFAFNDNIGLRIGANA